MMTMPTTTSRVAVAAKTTTVRTAKTSTVTRAQFGAVKGFDPLRCV